MKLIHTKKFRHGSVSLALTVVIIAAVILFNAIFSTIAEKYQWYIDMTPEPIFTLSDKAKLLVQDIDPDVEVEIMFCAEKDVWESDVKMMEVHKTALDIANQHDNIKIKYVDIFTNPSAVKDYKVRTGKNIDSSSVVITSGPAEHPEVKVFNLVDFFALDKSTKDVIGYDGEYVMVSAILAVTREEAPLLCMTTNHGELLVDNALYELMEDIGFEIKALDLSKEEIPSECRLLMIFDPKTDFLEKSSVSDVSEIDKLEKYLENESHMMVFFDAETPVLPNLEQFLGEWGIAIARTGGENHLIQDLNSSLSTDGFSTKAEYAIGGTGADITAQLRQEAHYPTAVFPQTGALTFSSLYTSMLESKEGYKYGFYSINPAASRYCYKVFTSSDKAVAYADGDVVAEATADDPFSYMLLACQSKMDSNTGISSNSFILASASTQFANAEALDSKFANRAVLSYACNIMGTLVVPVDIDCKYYSDSDITSITAKSAKQFTVVLTVVPASLIFIAGIYVMVRRKYA